MFLFAATLLKAGDDPLRKNFIHWYLCALLLLGFRSLSLIVENASLGSIVSAGVLGTITGLHLPAERVL